MEALEQILEKPDKTVSAEDFHQLRVEIKKLKALLMLAKWSRKKFKRKKYLKPYKKLFRQAGSVRDLQLEEEALKKHKLQKGALGDYAKEIRGQRQEEQEKFFALLHEEGIRTLEKDTAAITASLNRVRKKDVRSFRKARLKEIRDIYKDGIAGPEQVHELRKKVKSLFYITQLFPGKNGKYDWLETFQDMLGSWHDDVILENYLQKAIASATLTDNEKKKVRLARKSVHGRAYRLYKKILSEGENLHNGKPS